MRTTDPVRYWLITSARVDNPRLGDPMRVILVARSTSISGNGLIFDIRPWIGLALGTLLLSLLLWLPLLRGITRSVAQMKDATRQIADGQFQVRINSSRRDELGELGDSIDQMAARLDGFVQGQKRFLGDIAKTESIVMRPKSGTVRVINATHHFNTKPKYSWATCLEP